MKRVEMTSMTIANIFGEENTALAVKFFQRRREDLNSFDLWEHFLLHYHGMTMSQFEEQMAQDRRENEASEIQKAAHKSHA